MDAIQEDDLRRARSTPPETKLQRALDLMELGVELRAAALRQRHPAESEAQLAERLRAWLRNGT